VPIARQGAVNLVADADPARRNQVHELASDVGRRSNSDDAALIAAKPDTGNRNGTNIDPDAKLYWVDVSNLLKPGIQELIVYVMHDGCGFDCGPHDLRIVPAVFAEICHQPIAGILFKSAAVVANDVDHFSHEDVHDHHHLLLLLLSPVLSGGK